MQSYCAYKASNGELCGRATSGSKYCVLHHRSDSRAPQQNPDFDRKFSALISDKNGDWRGFVFPPGVKLPREIDFPINAAGCKFNSLDLEGVVFKGSVDFTEVTFNNGAALRSVTFEDTVTFDRCRFNGPVDFLNVTCRKSASFFRADFTGRSILRANFQGSANFNQAVFRDGVNFSGWRNITMRIAAATSLTMVGATSPQFE